MPGDYEKAITIEKAIKNIVERKYLLPAIQRKFEWDIDRICVLFDSIMRGYPINTFMFWEVQSQEVKNSFKFYQFLERYCERHAEDNPDFSLQGHGDFHAVIDGQQRLTSIYIGLKGTYANKLPRIHHTIGQDDSAYPPQSLYLNLEQPLNEENNENMMMYDFRFLTVNEFKNYPSNSNLFKVGGILDFKEAQQDTDVFFIAKDYLDGIGLGENRFALDTLTKLYSQIRRAPLIHYYNESSQTIDHVLDIFIRTNHGGKPLSFSDLLMSVAIASWKEDARQQIDDLVKNVWQSSDMQFSINRDLILKTALAITDADVRFKVGNFSNDIVSRIETEWEEIKACIVATFRLIKLIGLTDDSLRAKNAAIPIAYYLYHKGRVLADGKKGIYLDITNLTKLQEDREVIAKWLIMSLLKGVFGGQSDALLTTLRKVIKENLGKPAFPLQEIIDAFKGGKKNLAFDDDTVDRLLNTRKNDPNCFMILALLMPSRICTTTLHKDHLHPEAGFSGERLDQLRFLIENPSLRTFYEDQKHWDSVANLHLLDAAINQSKNASPLAEWVDSLTGGINDAKQMLMIPDDASLEFESFPDFFEKRRGHLASVLKNFGKSTLPTTAI